MENKEIERQLSNPPYIMNDDGTLHPLNPAPLSINIGAVDSKGKSRVYEIELNGVQLSQCKEVVDAISACRRLLNYLESKYEVDDGK